MRIFLLFIIPIFLCAGEYFGKVEPLQRYTISSKTSGLVEFTNDKLIGKNAGGEVVISIDNDVALVNYELAQNSYNIKRNFYQKIKNLSTKSKREKDNEKIAYLNAKQSYIRAKDELNAKTIKAKNLYIEDILVKKGSFVNPGTVLIKAYDISKAKITIYVNKEDLDGIESKKILVDGESGFKLLRYSKVADGVQVSSYKVELIGQAPKYFSKIAKVEFK